MNINNKNNHQSIRGFTLIELLIVIAIIGVLSTLLMANFIGVRQRARDSQRKSDLRQIQAALEIYRSDIGSYPATLKNCGSGSSVFLGNKGIVGQTDCATTYMQTIPSDPSGSGSYNSGNYAYQTDNATYTLGACLENSGDSQGGAGSPPGGTGPCPSKKYYVLTNP
jgi:general secretion pathway protein G